MEIFLQVIGSLVVGVVVILLAIYLYIRIKLGKYANIDTSEDLTPLLIHLNEEIDPDWIAKKNAQKIENELIDLGFTPDKTYNVVEMEGMQLKAFFKTPFTAILYTHPVAGLWVDMGAETENGIEYTVSNVPMGGEMDTPPHAKKYWHKEFTPAELYTKLKEVIGSEPIKALDASTFRDYFENVYKKEMQWKNKNGGIGFEEFMRVIENDPKNYKDDEIMEAFHEVKRKELRKWHNGAIEEYKKQESISENDCYDIYDYKLIVPSKSDPIGFIRYLADVYYLNEEQAKKLENRYSGKEITIQALFNQINEGFSPELRAVKISTIDYPIDIEIYEMSKDN